MLLATVVLWSCSGSGSEEIPNPVTPEESKTYEIQMNLGGEYVETSETPLSRTDTPKKYYGVNVYCMKDDGTTSSYSRFAFGVFDNVEDMKITLLGGYKYKFECTSVEDGEDMIHISESGALGKPFLYGSNNNNVTSAYNSDINKFTISSFENLLFIKEGDTYTNNLNDKFPRTNRYYGELENYIPTEDGKATIFMKRTVFGLKMIVNAIPDGTLSWSVNSPNVSFGFLSIKHSSHTGDETLEFSSIYTFSDVYASWKDEDYTTDFTFNFTWVRSNGYNQRFSKTISVKRNVMTNVNVTLEGGSSEINLGINEENAEMKDETVEVNYDGGSLSDTNVNPEE